MDEEHKVYAVCVTVAIAVIAIMIGISAVAEQRSKAEIGVEAIKAGMEQDNFGRWHHKENDNSKAD